MARARNIKPGFYKNEDLAECSIWARYIFPGLWMLADREGRLEDRPKRIKGELLPFDSQDIEPLLKELAARQNEQGTPFIIRYQNSSGRFIQISKFKVHQSPHYSEKDSVIKPPVFQDASADDGVSTPGKFQEHSGNSPVIKRGAQPPDSLIPDSLIPDSKPLVASATPPEFEEAWKRYPKRSGNNPKADALKSWNARIKEGVLPATMLAGLDRYAVWCAATDKVGTETVMQAVRFFGKSKPFEQSFDLPKKKPNGGSPWWSSDEGILAKAAELGIESRGGESWNDLKARVNAAMEVA